jgi:hypothetical protein
MSKSTHRTASPGRFLKSVMGLAMTAAFAPAALVATALAPTTASAADFDKASCRVHAVLAQKEGDGKIPANLSFLKEELESPAFAAFKSFRLLGSEDFKLMKDKPLTKKLASGHPMELNLRSASDKMVRLHVKLGSSGGRSLVDTSYGIKPDGFVLFAAGHSKGSVIFAVQCHGTKK